MKIILINGPARAGKDTMVFYCQNIVGFNNILHISTVDLIKDAAITLGWDGEKNERGRKFLSDLKDLASGYSDLSVKYIENKVNTANRIGAKAIFIDVREPEELERLKTKFNAITLFISNNRVKRITSNHADNNIENFDYDYYVENNGSLEELNQKARKFLKEIKVL